MSPEKKIYRPRVGMRFLLRGCEFEVCFSEFGMVRYAAVKGGKPFRVTFDRFLDMQKEEDLEINNPELHGQDQINGTPTLPNLSESELDSSLRRIRYAEAAVAELVHPNSKRKLKEWIPVFAESIKDSDPPAPRTVSEWVKIYLRDGKERLIAPERKRGNRTLRFSPEVHLLILEGLEEFLQEEQRDSKDVLAYVVGKLAEQNLLTKDGSKIRIPCERTIRRIINGIDKYLLVRIKKGWLAAEKMAKAAGKSIISPRPLYLVEIDTHYLKVFVVDPDTGEVLGKPYLSCAIDVRTRCVVGIYISMLPPSTASTLGVVKDMLTRPVDGLPGGIPVYVIPDNGIEFINSGVMRLFSRLKVFFEPAVAYDPNGKPHIESFFRTLSKFVIQKIQGTSFSNLEEREDYPSEKRAYATLDKIEEYVRFWIENEYHMRPHTSTGRVPIRHWEEELGSEKPMSLTKDAVEAIARRPFRSGIKLGRVSMKGQKYYSHALKTIEASHRGSVTVLVNELDLSYVLVEHPFEKGVLIKADSIDPEYTSNLTMWEHEEAMKIKANMTQQDLKAIGKFAPLLARWILLKTLQKDSQVARSKIAKLTGGKGLIQYSAGINRDFEDENILPSAVSQSPPPKQTAGTTQAKVLSTKSDVGDQKQQVNRAKAQVENVSLDVQPTTVFMME